MSLRLGVAGLVVASLRFAGCLPKDTRPEPGSLTVTVTSELPGGKAEWTTVDGWTIDYQRFLVSVRRANLDKGGSCNQYSDARYGRLYDALRTGSHKLSQQYGLGQCELGFRVDSPRSDDLLGPGVTKDDQTFMRTPGSDAWAHLRGISVHVEGTATKGTRKKHFVWSFRRRIEYSGCRLEAAGVVLASGVKLSGGDDQKLDLRLHGEALFQDDTDPTKAELRFDAFAQADDQYGNGDGEVTLEELSLVPLDSAAVEPGDAGGHTKDGGPWASLGDYVYLGLVRHVARYRDSGVCSVSESG
jgi:hypothetical protein